jgi:hypothetical protein
MTEKEWSELEPGMILTYENNTYRTASQDRAGRWIVEKLNMWSEPLSLVTLNVNDKRLKDFKFVKNHIASSKSQELLEKTLRRKVQ